MALKGSFNVGTFYGYATGARYGEYNPCTVSWTDVTRDKDTITIHNLTLTMKHVGTGWTSYRFACTGKVTGTTTATFANNYTLKAYNGNTTSNPDTITKNFGNVSVKTLGTSVSCTMTIASTKGSTSWNVHTSVSKTGSITCPSAYPTYTTQPSITNIQETSLVLKKGVTDLVSDYYYKKSGESTWTKFTTDTVTISGLEPGKSYTFDFQARNTQDTSLTKNGNSATAKTYLYPYITERKYENMVADETTQTISVYNPLKRTVSIIMREKNATQGENILYQKDITGDQHSFNLSTTVASSAIASNSFEGEVEYFCKYDTQAIAATIDGNITIKAENCKPIWANGTTIENLLSYKDGNELIVNMTKDEENPNEVKLIQRFSQLYYGVDFENFPATSNYFAEVNEYFISIDGSEFQKIETSSSEPLTRAQVKQEDNFVDHVISEHANAVSIRIKGRDTRGLETNILQKSIPVYQYNSPAGVASAYRQGGYGDTIVLQIVPVWGINQVKNAGTARYSYKEGGNTETAAVTISDFTEPKILPNLSNDSIFTFNVTLIDSLGVETQLDPIVVGLGKPILFIDSEQNGVGVNCFPIGSGLHVDGKTSLKGDTLIEGTLNIDGNVTVKGYALLGMHRNQIYEKENGTIKRTGWFYDEGGNS